MRLFQKVLHSHSLPEERALKVIYIRMNYSNFIHF